MNREHVTRIARSPAPLAGHCCRSASSSAGDEACLLEALRQKQRGADAVFFERYAPTLERIITRVLGTDPERADVMQDAFAAALAALPRLRDPVALEPWLSSIAANIARKLLRSRGRHRWLRRFADSAEESRCEPAGAALDVEARRALRGVYATLSMLSDDERVVFSLRHIDGMELTEVAAACQVSLATVKRRLVRAERRFHANARHHAELRQWLERGSKSLRPAASLPPRKVV